MAIPRWVLAARRWTGTGGVASLALAVLVFGCVLAATAGPRVAFNSRTKALQAAVAALSPVNRTVITTTEWNELLGQLNTEFIGDGQMNKIGRELAADFASDGVPPAPAAADWSSMTSGLQPVFSGLPAMGNSLVKAELGYRLPLASHVRVLAGTLAVPAPQPADPSAQALYFPVLDVAVTQQVARKLGLTLGSTVRVSDLSQFVPVKTPWVTAKVAAIVAQTAPGSSFWEADPSMGAPQLNVPGGGAPDYWTVGMLVLPGESAALQSDFGFGALNLQWTHQVDTGRLLGDQAQALRDGLLTATTTAPRLSKDLGTTANALHVNSGLGTPVTQFIANASLVDVVLWLLYVSLAVAAATAILLASWMITARRAGELALQRARGATLLQAGLAVGRGALACCVPAAAAAVAVTVLAVPGPVPPGGWWPGLAATAFAVVAPAALAAWQLRQPRTRRGQAAAGYARRGHPGSGYGALGYGRRRRLQVGTRVVTEVTLVLAAVAGLIVFRQQGLQAGSGVDFFTSAAPALVAVPAVIVVLRLYPLVMRALALWAARGRGASAFVGLARAARAALNPALPVFALVLAVTVAAFAGMVRDAVARGEVNASWAAIGADAEVSTYSPSPVPFTAAEQRAITSAPGVTHAAVASLWPMTTQDGDQVIAIAVDPSAYAALVASSQGFPSVNPAQLAGNQVLASPAALADLGVRAGGTAQLSEDTGVAVLNVRVAGTLAATNALAAGQPFVLMSDALAGHEPGAVPDVILLNGTQINGAQLSALAGRQAPTAAVLLRSKVLAQLANSPVQSGAFSLLLLAVAAAAGLGLAVLLLQLALGGAEREVTLARLATMGLTEGQRARLVLLEVLPGVLAAAVAAVASGLALPRVIAPSINLSVFTGSGSGASVPLAPDVASLAVPLAGLAVAAAVALGIEIRARRKVVATLRGGE